ncbi:unnamed protein product [Parnassius apollo]|uniref:(apollo) hypothetical protein n=1 Tax=Parnassius apollo TaxID=110799 RepID=A0A8S3W5E2_PARAO|nr:unnamed protein product [Parnassius apollo]
MSSKKQEGNSLNGNIQYAPLDLKPEEQTFYEGNKFNTKVTVPIGYNINTYANTYLELDQRKKNNIEPHLEDDDKLKGQTQESFVYGHNIKIPQAINSYQAYNVLYKSDNEYTTKVSQNQDNFIDPYLQYDKLEQETEKTLTKSNGNGVEIDDYKQLDNSPQTNKIYAANILKTEKVLSEKESPLIQPQMLHARPYRLHLNVARAYNIIHAPNGKARLFNKNPSRSQALLHKSDSTHLLECSGKERTKLLAVPNKLIKRRMLK